MANDLLVRGLSEGNVLASDSDNTQNFQNVYQNPVLISPNIKSKFGNAQSLAFSVDGHKQVFFVKYAIANFLVCLVLIVI